MSTPAVPELFIERITAMGADVPAVLAALATPLPRTVRVRADAASAAAVAAHAAAWQPVEAAPGLLRLQQPPQLGQTALHAVGALYAQEYASYLPVRLLAAPAGARVLDMCAAPGSKTGQLADAVGYAGHIVACEPDKERRRELVSNMERLAYPQVSVLPYSGQQAGAAFPGAFDYILLDSPCSSEGIAAKDPDMWRTWGLRAIHTCSRRSKELLFAAIYMLRPGGTLVYSTCTFAPEENEEVLTAALDYFGDSISLEPADVDGVQLAPAVASFQGAEYHADVPKYARRLWPQMHGSGGFFLAKIRKHAATELQPIHRAHRHQMLKSTLLTAPSTAKHLQRLLGTYGVAVGALGQPHMLLWGQDWYLLGGRADALLLAPAHLPGLHLAAVHHGDTVLTWQGALLLGRYATRRVLDVDADTAAAYLRGDDIAAPADANGQVIVRWAGLPLGTVLAAGGLGKNQLPRHRRLQAPVV